MTSIASSQVENFGNGVMQAEGVVVDNDGFVYGGGRNAVMYKVSPDGQVSEIATLPEGSIPNGIAMDRNGDIIYCDLGKQAMFRMTQSGQVSFIADHVGDVKLSLPNFACYDAEGNLYVSNTSTSDLSTVLPELSNPEPNGALVRIRPDGRGDVVAKGLYAANGVAIDPKEEAVYVLQSSTNDCVRIALRGDGSFGEPEVYSTGFPALPDGMAFDVDGNMYITLPGYAVEGGMTPANKIIAVKPNGEWSMLIDDADGASLTSPTNCAFGGPGLQDLYFANLEGDHFSRVHTQFHGHPLYHQR